jgi:hypothetical protein
MINENVVQETQGKTKDRITNQDIKQTQPTGLESPKAGTSTSSPVDNTTYQSDMNIVNTMLWMKKNAYEETTVRKVANLLRHLRRNCNAKDPETVTLHCKKSQ